MLCYEARPGSGGLGSPRHEEREHQ
jgi:hypothetical protein